MPTLPPSTDNAPTEQETLSAAVLEMTRNSSDLYPRLGRVARRELRLCQLAYLANLTALGVPASDALRKVA